MRFHCCVCNREKERKGESVCVCKREGEREGAKLKFNNLYSCGLWCLSQVLWFVD